MLITVEGASGVGKSTLIRQLAALRPQLAVAPPPWWPEFDEFVLAPTKWAARNQRGAIRATRAVLAAPYPGMVVTDASLRRTRLFTRALRNCGLVSVDEAAELDRLCNRAENSLAAPVALTVHLVCDESERRRRVASRRRPLRAADEYWQVQDMADALLTEPVTDQNVLAVNSGARLDSIVFELLERFDSMPPLQAVRRGRRRNSTADPLPSTGEYVVN